MRKNKIYMMKNRIELVTKKIQWDHMQESPPNIPVIVIPCKFDDIVMEEIVNDHQWAPSAHWDSIPYNAGKPAFE